jgi:hypothetical protein
MSLDSALCGTCAAIDIDRVFKLFLTFENGNPISTLSQIFMPPTPEYRLCQFFTSILPPAATSKSRNSSFSARGFHLRAVEADRYFGQLGQPKYSCRYIVLAVQAGQYVRELNDHDSSTARLVCRVSDERFCGRRISPDRIDYGLVRSWLRYYRFSHSCQNVFELPVPGFRVIDCESRRIIPVPSECHYVALSYVWGAQGSNPQQEVDNMIPSVAPRVVEDAIIATRKLGFHYLWIDRYCINQEAEDKHMQIRRMDLI